MKLVNEDDNDECGNGRGRGGLVLLNELMSNWLSNHLFIYSLNYFVIRSWFIKKNLMKSYRHGRFRRGKK